MTNWFGTDLPPGVRLSDIPGFRVEDFEDEVWWEIFLKKLADQDVPVPIMDLISTDEFWTKIIKTARDMGYEAGTKEVREPGIKSDETWFAKQIRERAEFMRSLPKGSEGD